MLWDHMVISDRLLWAGQRADSPIQENNNEASSFIQYECLPSCQRTKDVGWVELIEV